MHVYTTNKDFLSLVLWVASIGKQDRKWAPHSCSTQSAKNSHVWMKSTRKIMLFAIPMIWHANKEQSGFQYLQERFPSLSYKKKN